jgi:hypothetical protein
MARMLAVLVGLAALAVPATAPAATPLYGLTTDDRIVRMDADAPTSTGRTVPISGLRAGEHAVGLTTDDAGELWVITSASRRYRLDPWSGRLSELFGSGSLYDGRQFSPGIPSDRPVSVSNALGFVIAVGDTLWRPDFTQFTAETRAVSWSAGDERPEDPDVVALTSRPSDVWGDGVAVDGTQDALYALDISERLDRIGDLGVDVSAPAGLESLPSGTHGLLVSAAPGDRSFVHRVDFATGAATALGQTPAGVRFRDVTSVAPPTFTVRTPTLMNAGGAFEGGAPMTVPLVRTGDPEPAASVTVTPGQFGIVVNYGPATPGVDFDAAPQRVDFAAGQRTAEVTFGVLDDDVPEPWEDMGFALTAGPGARLARGYTGMDFIIGDDDAELPGGFRVNEGDVASIPVTRPPAGPNGLALPTQRTGGTATPGTDFALAPPVASFASLAGSASLALRTQEDARAEGDETVRLALAATPRDRVTGVSRTVTVTIVDDDLSTAALRRATELSARRRHRLGRLLPVTITCPAACRGTIEVRLDARRAKRARVGRRVVRRTVALRRAGRKTLRLRMSKRAVRRLRRVAPLRASLRLTVRSGTARPATVSRKLTLIR